MKKRRALFATVVAAVSLLSVSPGLGQTFESVQSLVVVDATGERIGPLVQIEGINTYVVPFKFGDHVFVLNLIKTRFRGIGLPFLYFESPGCNDQAAANLSDILNQNLIVPWSFVGDDGGTVYAQDPTAEPIESFEAFSRLRGGGQGCEDLPDPPTVIATAIPATRVVNMFDFFTPDFSVQAEIKKGKGPNK